MRILFFDEDTYEYTSQPFHRSINQFFRSKISNTPKKLTEAEQLNIF